jgi:transcriptional regulator with GAF, ATPase, and Fis domain
MQGIHSDAGGVRKGHTSGGAPIEVGLARDLSQLARELQNEADSHAVMQRIVQAAVDEIDGASAAAITLLERGRITSPVHTSPVATHLGQAQVETGEGPCVDTSRDDVTVRADDLRTEPRWPNFAPIAVAEGVLSMLSFQLFVERDSMGSLDVYADRVDAFDKSAENVGLLLASHAAIAMSASRERRNLRIALESRDIIGQAKGIVMERYKLTSSQAFDLLVRASQRRHRKLRELAEELATTGELYGLTDT